MFLSDFDFDLPEHLIARHPPAARRDARLLVVDAVRARFEDRSFCDLGRYLQPGDLLVLNDTRVIKARLRGAKSTGGAVEVMVERVLSEAAALAYVRASKSPKVGGEILLPDGCRATVSARDGSLFRLEFSQPLAAFLQRYGEVPLPPYIKRPAAPADEERYQTVYARRPGAVAAPTAGLHFDQSMLADLQQRGVDHCFVTLHVGAGTFQPLKESAVDDNRLHSERIELDAATAARIGATRAGGGRIVAVGTTTARVLEAASDSGELRPVSAETTLFIRPGYAFKTVDLLLTNFHLPRSSLLMLVSALAGRDTILDAYAHAVAAQYRFFSYGDAMLIITSGARR